MTRLLSGTTSEVAKNNSELLIFRNKTSFDDETTIASFVNHQVPEILPAAPQNLDEPYKMQNGHKINEVHHLIQEEFIIHDNEGMNSNEHINSENYFYENMERFSDAETEELSESLRDEKEAAILGSGSAGLVLVLGGIATVCLLSCFLRTSYQNYITKRNKKKMAAILVSQSQRDFEKNSSLWY